MEQVPTTASSALRPWVCSRGVDWSKASLWVRYGRFSGLRVRVGKRRVPATYEKGFMGAEVEVSVTNASRRPIVVRDVRLMLSGAYGAPVESSVLGEQSDPSLPATLDPGAQRQWYVKGYDQSWTRSRFLRRSASLFEGCGFVLSRRPIFQNGLTGGSEPRTDTSRHLSREDRQDLQEVAPPALPGCCPADRSLPLDRVPARCRRRWCPRRC